MVEAASGILPREDKAIAIRVPSLSGEDLGGAVGAGRFYADPQGFRLASLPSADGGDDEHWALGRHAGHAYLGMCLQPSSRGLAGCFPRGSSCRCRCQPTRIARKTLEPRPARGHGREEGWRRGHGRRLSPHGAGVRKASALTSNVVRLIARRGHVPRASCGLRGSAARLSPS
jgi:hypothetical protein